MNINWILVYSIWLVVVSLVLFVLYGVDKSRAKRDAWRIPEATLHWLALVGGFPGGWAGRSAFHHKTKKPLFILMLVVSTLIHLGIIYWFFIRKLL